MSPAIAHAAVIAILIVVAFAVLLAAAVVAASLLRPHPAGRHSAGHVTRALKAQRATEDAEFAAEWFRARATDTPAPGAEPGQAQDPARHGAPEAAAYVPAPGDAAASADPAPIGPPSDPGPGQHPFSAPVKVAFPDGNVAILGADHRWRIKPLTWDGRLTGEQPALVPGYQPAFEAWRDAAVNS